MVRHLNEYSYHNRAESRSDYIAYDHGKADIDIPVSYIIVKDRNTGMYRVHVDIAVSDNRSDDVRIGCLGEFNSVSQARAAIKSFKPVIEQEILESIMRYVVSNGFYNKMESVYRKLDRQYFIDEPQGLGSDQDYRPGRRDFVTGEWR